MSGLHLLILILPCLNFGALGSDDSEPNLTVMMKKLELMNKRFDEFNRKFHDVVKKIHDKETEVDRRMHLTDNIMMEMKADIQNLKHEADKRKSDIAQNSTDLEGRVSDLEDQMVLVEDEVSDMKLGLTAIADSVDELQETENVQNENIMFLQQQVCHFLALLNHANVVGGIHGSE